MWATPPAIAQRERQAKARVAKALGKQAAAVAKLSDPASTRTRKSKATDKPASPTPLTLPASALPVQRKPVAPALPPPTIPVAPPVAAPARKSKPRKAAPHVPVVPVVPPLPPVPPPGSNAALTDASESTLFVKILVIKVSSSILGLFGLIIGLLVLGKAGELQ
ncbi:hypothetical protein Pst134EA_027897 [Puccinia striiformis f. sp. tritici]|uniref:hypothetical protein n=1 Tax=Puccinia striiformis f. sp. tritici TaxID=168172 RepID=UPI002008B2C3|nr:hypothetical protein Pst134EA_027897 [Puccinia striiformis f. sp. tritici]KAH9448589.1 hypothetical protein Pst134EA_027897 [Puccinia striiformis f. sp. tritici]